MALETTGTMFSRWWRETISVTTPPKRAWMSAWVETTFERMRRPSSTTAAAVSSQEVSMARRSSSGLRQGAPGLGIGGARHALLAHDRGDVTARGHVEGGVAHGHALGGHPPAAVMGDFVRGALLDRD